MAVASLALVGIILVFGLLHGEEVRLMFLTAVSMAVAVVPEGLPAVVTIALALGAQRMLKRRALIRELEQAGCVLHRHGKRHDIYRNPSNGRQAPVPRHREIADTLCEMIRKQLGLAADEAS